MPGTLLPSLALAEMGGTAGRASSRRRVRRSTSRGQDGEGFPARLERRLLNRPLLLGDARGSPRRGSSRNAGEGEQLGIELPGVERNREAVLLLQR